MSMCETLHKQPPRDILNVNIQDVDRFEIILRQLYNRIGFLQV